MLEQRIQQQFFDSADLKYAAAEVLSKPIADAVERHRRLHHRRRQGAGLRQRRLGRRRPAFRRRVRRPLRARAPGPGGDRADDRHLDPDRDRQRLRLQRRSSRKQVQALGAPGDVLLAITTSGNSGQRARGRRSCPRQGHDRDRADRPQGRQDARASDRDRRAHLRATRPHRAHPGSAPAGAALPVRRGRSATAWANRKTHELSELEAPPPCCWPLAAGTTAQRLRAAADRRRDRRRHAGRHRPPHLGRAARRPGHRAEVGARASPT